MIIKKIEINNFRSYYKFNVFELDNGLNLIIGSNGDGKTTFLKLWNGCFELTEQVKWTQSLSQRKDVRNS